MIIVAIDPGFTTGVAVGEVIHPKQFDLINTYSLLWENRFETSTILDQYKPEVVVMEDFRLYRHKAMDQVNSPFPSARVIGSVDAFCWQRGIRVAMQPASVMSRVGILSKDKDAVGSILHIGDAYKHLRYYTLMNT